MQTSAALAEALAQLADRKKAEDIVVLDLRGRHSLFDYFVIATARGPRLAEVIGDEAVSYARQHRLTRRSLEVGEDWVCGDFGDVVLHVFTPEGRTFYDLEHLWADAPRVAWSERAPAQTGT
jgi:ribosome-associated protein